MTKDVASVAARLARVHAEIDKVASGVVMFDAAGEEMIGRKALLHAWADELASIRAEVAEIATDMRQSQGIGGFDGLTADYTLAIARRLGGNYA